MRLDKYSVYHKADMRIGMIYGRMYIGGHITVVPYLEVIWCIPFQLYIRFGCFLVSYFVIF